MSIPDIRLVDWNDPVAVDLRAAMDRDVGPRYADRFEAQEPARQRELDTAFAIDPADMKATFVLYVDERPVAHAA